MIDRLLINRTQAPQSTIKIHKYVLVDTGEVI